MCVLPDFIPDYAYHTSRGASCCRFHKHGDLYQHGKCNSNPRVQFRNSGSVSLKNYSNEYLGGIYNNRPVSDYIDLLSTDGILQFTLYYPLHICIHPSWLFPTGGWYPCSISSKTGLLDILLTSVYCRKIMFFNQRSYFCYPSYRLWAVCMHLPNTWHPVYPWRPICISL